MDAPGEVAEWSNAPDLKSGELKGSVGSNPTLSVFGLILGLSRSLAGDISPDLNVYHNQRKVSDRSFA